VSLRGDLINTKGIAMTLNGREPLDLVDHIYTVAYWMTGSLKKTNILVYKTYQMVDAETTEVQLFKTFRTVFQEHFCLEAPSLAAHLDFENEESPESESNHQEMDGRLAVLLAEVCQLNHHAIARILDKPVDKIRLMLISKRKSMLKVFLNLALFCCVDLCYS
jgi:hypothetical protein